MFFVVVEVLMSMYKILLSHSCLYIYKKVPFYPLVA